MLWCCPLQVGKDKQQKLGLAENPFATKIEQAEIAFTCLIDFFLLLGGGRGGCCVCVCVFFLGGGGVGWCVGVCVCVCVFGGGWVGGWVGGLGVPSSSHADLCVGASSFHYLSTWHCSCTPKCALGATMLTFLMTVCIARASR